MTRSPLDPVETVCKLVGGVELDGVELLEGVDEDEGMLVLLGVELLDGELLELLSVDEVDIIDELVEGVVVTESEVVDGEEDAIVHKRMIPG